MKTLGLRFWAWRYLRRMSGARPWQTLQQALEVDARRHALARAQAKRLYDIAYSLDKDKP